MGEARPVGSGKIGAGGRRLDYRVVPASLGADGSQDDDGFWGKKPRRCRRRSSPPRLARSPKNELVALRNRLNAALGLATEARVLTKPAVAVRVMARQPSLTFRYDGLSGFA